MGFGVWGLGFGVWGLGLRPLIPRAHNPGWANSIYEPGGAQLPKTGKDTGGGGAGGGEGEVFQV